MTRTAKAVVDLAALKHNLNIACKAAPNSKVVAVIKANAYGHGMAEVARVLVDADAFAVACLDEAIALRQVSSKRIIVLQGFHSADQIEAFVQHALDPVLHQRWQVEALEQAGLAAGALDACLKIDTGMHRLGVPAEEVLALVTRLQQQAAVRHLTLMTHMACADDLSDNYTAEQLAEFERLTREFGLPRSAANSASVLGWPEARMEWVRPGIMLYGVAPFLEAEGPEYNLKPAMRLSTRLIAINSCHMGDAVGYGSTWVCPRDMRIGIAAIGYGDGYPRHAPSGTPVVVNGRETHLVGRVSMDMISIDLTGLDDINVGDEVVLWGPELPVERVAAAAGTIAYELLCSVDGHVKYEYKV